MGMGRKREGGREEGRQRESATEGGSLQVRNWVNKSVVFVLIQLAYPSYSTLHLCFFDRVSQGTEWLPWEESTKLITSIFKKGKKNEKTAKYWKGLRTSFREHSASVNVPMFRRCFRMFTC